MSPFKSSAGRALGKMLEGYKSSDIGKGFGSSSNLFATGTQDDPFTNGVSLLNTNTSGNYWFKTSNMTTATEYYLDCDTVTDQKYIRIWISTTNNYDTNVYNWPDGETSNLILTTDRWMYAFVNPNTNATTQAWTWAFYSGASEPNYNAFRNNPPMHHGGSGTPLITRINSTQISSGTDYNGYYLRTGWSSFSSACDDSRSGEWGQICLKGSNTDSSTGQGGLLDFPQYASFDTSTNDHCSESSQNYNGSTCSDTRRFAVYVKLSL